MTQPISLPFIAHNFNSTFTAYLVKPTLTAIIATTDINTNVAVTTSAPKAQLTGETVDTGTGSKADILAAAALAAMFVIPALGFLYHRYLRHGARVYRSGPPGNILSSCRIWFF